MDHYKDALEDDVYEEMDRSVCHVFWRNLCVFGDDPVFDLRDAEYGGQKGRSGWL